MAILGTVCLAALPALSSDASIAGGWVMTQVSQEDHAYPGSTDWQLALSLREDGRFVWSSSWKGGERADETMVAGYYSIMNATITYAFDTVGQVTKGRLEHLFSLFPTKGYGQQSIRRNGEGLLCANEGEKLWVHMRRDERAANLPDLALIKIRASPFNLRFTNGVLPAVGTHVDGFKVVDVSLSEETVKIDEREYRRDATTITLERGG